MACSSAMSSPSPEWSSPSSSSPSPSSTREASTRSRGRRSTPPRRSARPAEASSASSAGSAAPSPIISGPAPRMPASEPGSRQPSANSSRRSRPRPRMSAFFGCSGWPAKPTTKSRWGESSPLPSSRRGASPPSPREAHQAWPLGFPCGRSTVSSAGSSRPAAGPRGYCSSPTAEATFRCAFCAAAFRRSPSGGATALSN